MIKNIHPAERVMRIILGVGILFFTVVTGSLWFLLGLIPLATGILGWCPPYQLLGINTCKLKTATAPQKVKSHKKVGRGQKIPELKGSTKYQQVLYDHLRLWEIGEYEKAHGAQAQAFALARSKTRSSWTRPAQKKKEF